MKLKIELDELFEYKDDKKFMKEVITLISITFLAGCFLGIAIICICLNIFL